MVPINTSIESYEISIEHTPPSCFASIINCLKSVCHTLQFPFSAPVTTKASFALILNIGELSTK